MRWQSRVLHTALVCGLLIGLLTYTWMTRSGAVSPDAIRRAALQQDWEAVVALTDALPVSGSEAEQTMLLRAEALLEQQRFEDSYQLLEGFAVSAASDPDALLHLQARAAFETGRLDTAADLSGKLAATPSFDTAAQRRLAVIHHICGQQQQAQRWYVRLLKSGAIRQNELIVLADLERPVDLDELTEQWADCDHDDAGRWLAETLSRFHRGQTHDLTPQLEAFVRQHPNEPRAWAMLGECLMDGRQFGDWLSHLPETARSESAVWIVCGRRLAAAARPRMAAACLAQAVQLAPTSRRAHYELSQLLTAIDHPQAATVTRRAQQLFDLAEHLDVLMKTPAHEPALRRTIENLIDQGRDWEAIGWAVLAGRHHPDHKWPEQMRAQIATRLTPGAPFVPYPIDLSDLSGNVLWTNIVDALRSDSRTTNAGTSGAEPRFRETTPLTFAYQNGARANTGPRMFEITGGGIGVLDFDRDQWPDLFFPQGGRWDAGRSSPPQSLHAADEIHRNLRGTGFAKCDAAGLTPGGFGQGCAVGDYNNDGFEDLLVANIGRNQLLLNMGDGTFRDVSSNVGFDRADWTTSCAMADLNTDGLPELLFVNYVTDDDVYTRVCQGHSCSPGVFEGVPDELLMNTGDGRFVRPTALLPLSAGNGLGVIIARLGGHGLDIFVANDQVQNACLHNLTGPGDEPQLQSGALASGLAYSDDGLAMACMGVASGDANGDGRLDLFVTNFRDEPNTLYTQNPGRLFLDTTRSSGLRSASLAWVGWGTQFLDANNDGHEDLVLVNGHVDVHPEHEGGYAMPPQLFCSTAERTFDLHQAQEPDDFFAQTLVGRSVVRLDWNRDGRPDFAVSTLTSHARLATNTTQGAGTSLQLRLVGTRSARDAIGSEVTVHFHGQSQYRQLVAGDGYMASNERVLMFGTASHKVADRVRITWPSGRQSTFENLATDRQYTVIEPSDSHTPARIVVH